MHIHNQAIFEELTNTYGKLIFSICYSLTNDYFEAEDLTQDVFVSAFLNFENFDGRKPKAWLTTIAANKCRDYLKSAARRCITLPDDELSQNIPSAESAENSVLEKSVNERLLDVCSRLKEPYQTLSVAYYINGKTITEISSDTGQNLKTLQTRLYRAKAMLRKLWKEEL